MRYQSRKLYNKIDDLIYFVTGQSTRIATMESNLDKLVDAIIGQRTDFTVRFNSQDRHLQYIITTL